MSEVNRIKQINKLKNITMKKIIKVMIIIKTMEKGNSNKTKIYRKNATHYSSTENM